MVTNLYLLRVRRQRYYCCKANALCWTVLWLTYPEGIVALPQNLKIFETSIQRTTANRTPSVSSTTRFFVKAPLWKCEIPRKSYTRIAMPNLWSLTREYYNDGWRRHCAHSCGWTKVYGRRKSVLPYEWNKFHVVIWCYFIVQWFQRGLRSQKCQNYNVQCV